MQYTLSANRLVGRYKSLGTSNFGFILQIDRDKMKSQPRCISWKLARECRNFLSTLGELLSPDTSRTSGFLKITLIRNSL